MKTVSELIEELESIYQTYGDIPLMPWYNETDCIIEIDVVRVNGVIKLSLELVDEQNDQD